MWYWDTEGSGVRLDLQKPDGQTGARLLSVLDGRLFRAHFRLQKRVRVPNGKLTANRSTDATNPSSMHNMPFGPLDGSSLGVY